MGCGLEIKKRKNSGTSIEDRVARLRRSTGECLNQGFWRGLKKKEKRELNCSGLYLERAGECKGGNKRDSKRKNKDSKNKGRPNRRIQERNAKGPTFFLSYLMPWMGKSSLGACFVRTLDYYRGLMQNRGGSRGGIWKHTFYQSHH